MTDEGVDERGNFDDGNSSDKDYMQLWGRRRYILVEDDNARYDFSEDVEL